MRARTAAAVMAAVTVAGCSSTAAPPTSSTSTRPGPLTVVLTAAQRFGGKSEFPRDRDDRTCQARLDGSATGTDKSGTLTLKTRQGTVLGSALIPDGAVQNIRRAPGGEWVGNDCVFTVQVPIFEAPTDLVLAEFVWPAAKVTVNSSGEVTGDRLSLAYSSP